MLQNSLTFSPKASIMKLLNSRINAFGENVLLITAMISKIFFCILQSIKSPPLTHSLYAHSYLVTLSGKSDQSRYPSFCNLPSTINGLTLTASAKAVIRSHDVQSLDNMKS